MPTTGAQTELKLSQFFITVNGSPASANLMGDLKSIEVDLNLFMPAMCEIEINHVDPWAGDANLGIGKTVKIEAQSADGVTKSVIFNGEITAIEGSFREEGHNFVIIRAYDRLHRLQHETKARTFVQVTDSDLASRIAGDHGLQPKTTSTRYVHPQIFQDNVTDYEFLMTRARANGFILRADDRKLEFGTPPPESGVSLKVGETLAEFHPRRTVAGQRAKVTVRGWDPKTKKAVVGQATSSTFIPGALTAGNRGHQWYSQGIAQPGPLLVTDQPVPEQAAGDALAQGLLDQLWSTDVSADGTAFGNPLILPGKKITVEHAGAFNGSYYVSSARHVYASGLYLTHFRVSGLHAQTISDLVTEGAAPGKTASGRVMNGVAMAIVTDNDDPDNLGRVKVKFPWFSEDLASFWVRIATPMAGPERGLMIIPEVNDEVLVAFEQGDFNHPFIIGALWNGIDKPPQTTSETISGGKVNKRILKTRAGHILRFDDTSGSEKIEIIDKTGKNLIMIESSSNKMTIQADGDIEITSKKDIKMKGLNLSFEGQTKAEMKAAQIDVTATAKTTIKGATVEIN
jgi:uncharacterized protein involved in type VI secretion and phage assembly